MLGVSVAGCCFFSVLVLGLGAFADDSTAPTAATSPTPGTGGAWQMAVEVARATTFSQPLAGGRWVAQYGSNVDHVVGRVGTSAWVQTNTSGSIYELTFEEDGSYAWRWSSGLTMNGARFDSHCTEKGSWTLSGRQLALQPESQASAYSNSGGTQEKTDQDLGARRYELFDLTMETLPSADPARPRFPAMKLIGPKAAWDTGSGNGLELTMQRLTSD